VHDVDAGINTEQPARTWAVLAGRGHADLPIGLGIGDELGTVLGENDGVTCSTSGVRTTPPTGAMSRRKLKLSLS
jgi:hypothetical protein